MYPVEVVGPRVRLREVTVDDAPVAMAWAADRDWFRYLPHEPVASVSEEQAFLRGLTEQAQAQPRQQHGLGIVDLASGDLAGLARLGVSDPENRTADIGYGVRRDLWGFGLGTEAAGLLLRLGFGLLGLHRIWAYHHPDNVASGRVLAKIGMTKEGHLRQNMLAHGAWRDSIVWAILEPEWRSYKPDDRRDNQDGQKS
jgi:[ribosomal protein S5]-alanine N-acetyltransferase